MHRIDSANARPDQNGGNKSGFNDNADLQGQDATYLTPKWCNAVQEEIANAIEVFEPLNADTNDQLAVILREMESRLSTQINQLTQDFNQYIIDERNRIWPIGRGRYTTYDGSNPGDSDNLGWGTWELDAVSSGRVLVGEGIVTDTNGVERTFISGQVDGELEHTMTTAELVPHKHTYVEANTGGALGASGGASSTMGIKDSGPTGDGQAFNLMQPYLVVSIWRRVE